MNKKMRLILISLNLLLLVVAVYFATHKEEAILVNGNIMTREGVEETEAVVYDSTYENLDKVYDADISHTMKQKLDSMQKKNRYTEDRPLLVRNAFGTNECSYYISFKTKKPVYMEYTVHSNKESIPDFTRKARNGRESKPTKEHAYQLIGFVPGVRNSLTIHLYLEDGTLYKEKTFHDLTVELTHKIPYQLEYKDGTSTEPLEDGLYTVTTTDTQDVDAGCDAVSYDQEGVVRSVLPVKDYRSTNIHQVGEDLLYSVSSREIVIVSPLGQVKKKYGLGHYSYHHDYQYDPESKLLYLLANDKEDKNNYVEDVVITLDLITGEVEEIIDFKDLFPDLAKKASPKKQKDRMVTDWIHMNSMTFGKSTDEIIFSARELSAIISIENVSTKPKIKYIIADPYMFEGCESESYLLKKDTSLGDFDYQYGQHNVVYLEDESLEKGSYYLTMFNNNSGFSVSRKSIDWSTYDHVGKGISAKTQKKGIYSYYYKYLVDEVEGTFQLVESIPIVYSGIMSNAGYVGENIISVSGTSKVFEEYDKNGNSIRQFKVGGKNNIYRVFKYDFW